VSGGAPFAARSSLIRQSTAASAAFWVRSLALVFALAQAIATSLLSLTVSYASVIMYLPYVIGKC
jgi:hypothetical protein